MRNLLVVLFLLLGLGGFLFFGTDIFSPPATTPTTVGDQEPTRPRSLTGKTNPVETIKGTRADQGDAGKRKALAAAGLVLFGRVTELETGKPVESFRLVLTLGQEHQKPRVLVAQNVKSPTGQFSLGLEKNWEQLAGVPELKCLSENHLPRTIRGREGLKAGTEINLVLDPGGQIKGVVVEATGNRPVAGAQVSFFRGVRWGMELLDTSGYTPRCKTDSRGRFKLTGLSREFQKIIAIHPDFAQGFTGAEPGKDQDIRITLSKGMRVFGTVKSDQGELLAGMPIRFSGRQLPISQQALTGKDGKYRSPVLPAGFLLVRADPHFIGEAGRALPFSMETANLTLVDQDVELNFGPTAGQISWQGRLLDEVGKPVTQATILMLAYGGPRRQGSTKAITDGEGRFHLRKLQPVLYGISFTLRENMCRFSGENLTLSHTGVLNRDIRISNTAIAGEVLDGTTGKRLTGQLCRITGRRRGNGYGSCELAPDGTFKLRGIRPGEYKLTATVKGLPEASCDGIKVVPDRVCGGQILTITPGGTATLVLTGCQKADPGYFSIHLTHEDDTVIEKDHLQIKEDGSFKESMKLGSGLWQAKVTFIGFLPIKREIVIKPGKTTIISMSGEELQKGGYAPAKPAPGTITLKGTLTDPKGSPIAGVKLFFVGRNMRHLAFQDRYVTGKTNAKGGFALKGFRPGTWNISGKTKGGGEPNFPDVIIPKNTKDQYTCKLLLADGKIRGNLVNAATGQPFGKTGPVWWTFLSDTKTRLLVAELNGGHKGPRFNMVGIPGGEYKLQVRAHGFNAHTSKPFTLETGQNLDVGEIRLSPNGTLELEVMDSTQQPIKTFKVYANGRELRNFRRRDLGAGRYHYFNIPLGNVGIKVKSPGYQDQEQPITFKGGTPQKVLFTMQKSK